MVLKKHKRGKNKKKKETLGLILSFGGENPIKALGRYLGGKGGRKKNS